MYGQLNSRADFQRVLGEAIDFADQRDVAYPGDPALQVIKAQLEKMREWTENDRVPTDVERGRITVGMVAAREMSDTNDPEVDNWVDKVSVLWNFFEAWPTDAEASSSIRSDAVALLAKIDHNREAARRWHAQQKEP
ncbi:MAG TPA: immunity protein Tsi6 family protein [Polyangiales bacterium]